MAQKKQRGWLKKESRAQGETWVLFFRKSRKSDGRRVENNIPIGLVKDLPDKENAWAEIERLHLPINQVNPRRGVIFGDLAQHYAEHELLDHTESIHAKAHTTVRSYERVGCNRLLPRWGNRIALGIEPLEVEQWLKELKREKEFANPTLDKTRRVMSMIYKHGQRYRLILRPQLQKLIFQGHPKIAIKAKGKILFINPGDVVAVQAEGNYVSLQRESDSYLLRESISRVAEKLKPYGFIRIHRSALVNTTFVVEIKPYSTGKCGLRVKGGKEYAVTSAYRKNLKPLTEFRIGNGAFLAG